MDATSSVEYRSGYFPGVVGAITRLHGEYYAKEWGADAVFEIQMSREICDFVERYDAAHDLLLAAVIGGRTVGCIAMLGASADAADSVRLRWFLLDAAFQGKGIGTELLGRAMFFAKERFRRCTLWTVSGLPASMHMYQALGFHVVEREVDARYGVERESLRLEVELADVALPFREGCR